MAGAASRLTVGRLSIEARMPRDQPIPPGIGIRLEAMAREELQPSLADALQLLCPESDPAVWVIRRLDLELLVDVGWNRDRMAGRWAREFAQSLTRILHGPVDGNVLRFPDRASYLAQFLRDLAGDRAWGRWYYGPFRGLSSLPRSAAIREALAREPAIAEPALLALAAQHGARELRHALTIADAAKILELIRGKDSSAEPTAESIEAAIEAAPEVLPAAADELRSKAALVLQLALRQSRPALPRPVVTAAVEALLDLIESLREVNDLEARLDSILAEPAKHEAPAKIAISTALKKAESRARLIELARTGPAKIEAMRSEGHCLPTAFAGLFLLWRSVVVLGFESFFAGDAMRRSLLAAKLVGMAALEDPAVQLLTGAEKTPSHGDLLRSLRETAAQDLWACLPSATSEGDCLRLEEIPWPDGRRLLLLRNAAGDNWLWGAIVAPDRVAESTAEGFAVVADRHPGLAPAAAGGYLERIRPILPDLAHLALPPLQGESIEAADELPWSLMAHAVYRDFSRRLPGFAWSSIGHLHRNFIAGEGEIRIDVRGDRRVITATLPAAPLQLVLRMTGLSGSRFSLPGEPPTDVVLALPGG
jgi:hypothetical protein